MKSNGVEIRHIKGRTVRVTYFGPDSLILWVVDVLTNNGWEILMSYLAVAMLLNGDRETDHDYYFDQAGAVL